MVGFFVAASIVSLVQWLRVKERRLLPLLALFLLLALSDSRESWDPWKRWFELLAGGAGLVLLVMLTPRHDGTA
jgi:hypothetical protein